MGMISRIEASAFRPAGQPVPAAFAELTPTQMKVLQGVYSGLLNKQIAFDLGISEITVKLHRGNATRKLEAGSIGQLIRIWESLPADIRGKPSAYTKE